MSVVVLQQSRAEQSRAELMRDAEQPRDITVFWKFVRIKSQCHSVYLWEIFWIANIFILSSNEPVNFSAAVVLLDPIKADCV